MSLQVIEKAIANKKMTCPSCSKPIKHFEEFVASPDPNGRSTVTLICGNRDCEWKQRTEWWSNYYFDDGT
jgi:RNase P subunit RPR2